MNRNDLLCSAILPFFSCQSEEECNLLYELVTSEPAREFWSALIFWDAKWPITAQLLNSLDLMVLARLLVKECDRARTLAERQIVEYTEGVFQRLLFREEAADYGSEPVSNELDLPAAQPAASAVPRA
jgi:hypothetical protein